MNNRGKVHRIYMMCNNQHEELWGIIQPPTMYLVVEQTCSLSHFSQFDQCISSFLTVRTSFPRCTL